MYLNFSPWWLQRLYPSLCWHKERKRQEVFLTFDDGPHPEITPKVLDLLTEYKAKATFFLIGKNAEAHPEIVERILREGHAIGNHTYHHLNGWQSGIEPYLEDVKRCAEILDSPLFRPPYGRISRRQIRELKKQSYEIIMWDVLSGDFDLRKTGRDCSRAVQKYLRAGSIVVFHDSEKAWPRLQYCLPEVLKFCEEENYKLKALNPYIPRNKS